MLCAIVKALLRLKALLWDAHHWLLIVSTDVHSYAWSDGGVCSCTSSCGCRFLAEALIGLIALELLIALRTWHVLTVFSTVHTIGTIVTVVTLFAICTLTLLGFTALWTIGTLKITIALIAVSALWTAFAIVATIVDATILAVIATAVTITVVTAIISGVAGALSLCILRGISSSLGISRLCRARDCIIHCRCSHRGCSSFEDIPDKREDLGKHAALLVTVGTSIRNYGSSQRLIAGLIWCDIGVLQLDGMWIWCGTGLDSFWSWQIYGDVLSKHQWGVFWLWLLFLIRKFATQHILLHFSTSFSGTLTEKLRGFVLRDINW